MDDLRVNQDLGELFGPIRRFDSLQAREIHWHRETLPGQRSAGGRPRSA